LQDLGISSGRRRFEVHVDQRAAGVPTAAGDRVQRTKSKQTGQSTKSIPASSRRRAKSGAQKVKVAVSDIDGILRGKYLHIDKFLGAPSLTPTAASAFATWCWAGT
jgi:hypothetical protein